MASKQKKTQEDKDNTREALSSSKGGQSQRWSRIVLQQVILQKQTRAMLVHQCPPEFHYPKEHKDNAGPELSFIIPYQQKQAKENSSALSPRIP